MPETIRQRLNSVICEHLVDQQGFGMDDAFETACDLANDIFHEFLVEPSEQDMKGGWLVIKDKGKETLCKRKRLK